jgi:hypothetical protein
VLHSLRTLVQDSGARSGLIAPVAKLALEPAADESGHQRQG